MSADYFLPAAAPAPVTTASFPELWRASELAIMRTPTRASGHIGLDSELPNRGWPRSALIELLVQKNGIGELQLLKPVLSDLAASQRIALVQPPYLPQTIAFRNWGIATEQLLWVRAERSGDALWSTEQLLKHGCCCAVIFWQNQVRNESLRRLHLAAQSTETCFWLIRPLSCAAEPSPALLRLGLKPAVGGVAVDILKRRGPQADQPLFVPLADMPTSRHPLHHENSPVTQPPPAPAAARSAAPMLV